jgi:hypothetical protein|tara:strand:+ start:21643 stop:22023 length:381 start_codon:yes stop_codon:yes gene_type:complete
LDDSGGTARVLSQYIISIGGIKINSGMVDSTGFGDSWTESLSTGKRTMDDITIEAWYDDASNTTDDVLGDVAVGPADQQKTLLVAYGGSKTTSVEGWIVDYERVLDKDSLHIVRATFRPSGAVTEA